MGLSTPPTWIRSTAWLALPLAAAVGITASRRFAAPEPPRYPGQEKAVAGTASEDLVAAYSHRIRQKNAILADLLERRKTLLEAAAQFRALDEVPPLVHRAALEQHYPGRTMDERYCRQVIDWLEKEFVTENRTDDGTIDRLRSELEEALRHEPFRLPDVSLPNQPRLAATAD